MTRLSALAAAATALALAAAGPVAAQSPSSPPPPPPAPTSVAMPFMQVAGESDVYEISASQLAVMRTQNPRVRDFASMLIGHHTMTSNILMAQAKSAGLTPPPAVLGPRTRGMLDQLYSASPTDFDRLYLQQQVPAHEQALALQSNYAATGDTPQLRTAAKGAVPIIQKHLDAARALLAAS